MNKKLCRCIFDRSTINSYRFLFIISNQTGKDAEIIPTATISEFHRFLILCWSSKVIHYSILYIEEITCFSQFVSMEAQDNYRTHLIL